MIREIPRFLAARASFPSALRSTASILGPNVAASVGPPPIFRVPDDSVAPLGQALKSYGLDENRWFACLHMREHGYYWRRAVDPMRSVDPLSYVPMVEHIV